MATTQPLVFTPAAVRLPSSGALRFVPAAPQQTAALPAPVYNKPFVRRFSDNSLSGPRKVVAHFQMSCYEYGGGWDGYGTVAGYAQSAANAAAIGFDGFALDTGGSGFPYPGSVTNLFAGLNQRNQANGGAVDAMGVSDVQAYMLFDMSTFPEDAAGQAAMASLFLAHCHDPAYMTYQGRPILSTYVGEGGSWANVKAVFGNVLSIIRAAGINPFFMPGFIPTDINGTYVDRENAASITAWANGLIAGFADAAWQYPSGHCPLGPGSGIPGDECSAAAVQALGKPYMRGVMPHYWGSAHGTAAGDTRFYEEFRGGEGVRAYMQSILRMPIPPFMIQVATWNDFEEASWCSPADPNLQWPELQHKQFPGYYVSKAGLDKELSYWFTWYKSGQEPALADDTLIFYVRPQTAAVTLTQPDQYGPITQVDNPSSDPPGVLQDLLFVTAIVKASGYVQCQFLDAGGKTIAGSGWTRFVTAGINHISGPFVDGTPVLTLLRDGQSVLSLSAPAIVSTAACINANYMTGFETV